jgi:hypothetical protein
MAIPHRRQGAVSVHQPITAQAFQSLPVTHNRRKFHLKHLLLSIASLTRFPPPFTPEIGDKQFSFPCIYFDIRLQLRGISAIRNNGCSQKSQEQAPHQVCLL